MNQKSGRTPKPFSEVSDPLIQAMLACRYSEGNIVSDFIALAIVLLILTIIRG